jgi:hypothetical protein
MQIILAGDAEASSAAPQNFFKRAFGQTNEEFETLLMRPERFLFNRAWYEQLGGRAEFEEYMKDMAKLSQTDRSELMALLSGTRPSQFAALTGATQNSAVKSAIHWYAPMPKDQEALIWQQAKLARVEAANEVTVPDDERVEDAGLAEVA